MTLGDPEVAVEYASNMPNSAERPTALRQTIRTWVQEGDPAQALAWLQKQPISPVYDWSLDYFATTLSVADPASAEAALMRISDPARKSKVASTLVERSSLAGAHDVAARWAAKHLDGPARMNAYEKAALSWGARDPAAACQHITAQTWLQPEQQQFLIAKLRK